MKHNTSFKLFSRFFFIALVVINVNSCFSLSEDITYYQTIIPQEENINASLLHYEQLKEKIVADYSAQNYFSVLSNINLYIDLFAVNNQNDTGWIDIYLARVIRKTIATDAFRKYYGSLKYEYRLFYALSVKKKSKRVHDANGVLQKNLTVYEYKENHVQNVITNQKNYVNEKIGITDLMLPNLIDSPSSVRALKKNLKDLTWFVSRYPDVPFYHTWVSNQNYFPSNILSASANTRQAYQALTNFLSYYQHQLTDKKNNNSNKAFVNNYFAILLNRMNKISSRNLGRIEKWELVIVLRSNLVGEVEGERWAWVKTRDNLTGYLPQDNLMLLSTLESDKVNSAKKKRKIANQYFATANLLYQNKLFDAFKQASFRLEHTDGIWQERYSVLLNEILKEIAKRATSQNNPYTAFVLRYPKYFALHINKTDVVPSNLVLKKLLSLNKQSTFMTYFDNL